MRILFLLASLLPTAVLAQVPISPIPFDTEVDAVKYVASDGMLCSANHQECGGVIYKKGEHYYVTPPRTSHKAFTLDNGFFYLPENQMPGYTITADWHVHICSVNNRMFANYFSAGDVDANDGLHINGYMVSNCDGNIRMYRPGLDERDEEVDMHNTVTGKKRVIYLTIGHYVGWIDRTNLSMPHRYVGLDPQGHLEGIYKKDDICPVGVYSAPGGNLQQCGD